MSLLHLKAPPMRHFTYDQVLTDEACDYLVKFFSQNIETLGKTDKNSDFSSRTINFSSIDFQRDRHFRMAKQLLNMARLKACNLVKNQYNLVDLYPEFSQIVRWPMGSSQDLHKDVARQSTTHAGIIYLNDNFKGGETEFPEFGELVQPKKGMLLGFPGRDLLHGVKKVQSGNRFTVACWFTPQVECSEF
jgi:hypothetical protein